MPVGVQPRPGRPVLVVLLLASTLGVMGGATIAPIIEVIRQDLAVGGTEAGLILTSHSLAIAVLSPLAGRAADRFGIRVPLAGGLVLYGVGGGAGMLTSTLPTLLATRLVLGAGAAAVFTCSTVAMLALYQGPDRDRVMGWRTTAVTVGGFAYPLAAGVLGHVSWHAPFAIYLVGVPLGVATLLIIPAGTAASIRPDQGAGSSPTGRRGAVRLLRDRPLLLGLCGIWVATAGLMMVLAVFLPRRLDQLGIQDTVLVAVYSMVVSGAAASLAGLAYARLRTRLSYPALLRGAVLCWTAAFVAFAVADHPVPLLLVPALTGLGSGLAMPTLTVLIDHTAPPGRRGTATSLQGSALFGGQFVSPLVFGPLIEATSITVGALTAAAGTTLMFIALLRLPDPEWPASRRPAAPGDGPPDGTARRTPPPVPGPRDSAARDASPS
ncbi:putative MFS family arabinose efflux permease [Micromonospora sp. Llam0]|uniref:MFS transporter n=1 Tax=Micromonospora sp. Llam0 TaxID=2485143 RepID=UPI000F47585E|nr:MFS transporter [Micromonospora sp. Llam0]ROO63111.1 putative MFS family arabinose efflux permease [Micromonospora sp. Llam0]